MLDGERVDQLRNVLEYIYGKVIGDIKNLYKAEFVLLCAYFAMLLPIIVVAKFLANIEGFLTTIGVSALSIASLLQKMRKTWYGYYVEPKLLKRDVSSLIARLKMCKDDADLSKIEGSITNFLDKIDQKKLKDDNG
jgi:hypothetical protein